MKRWCSLLALSFVFGCAQASHDESPPPTTPAAPSTTTDGAFRADAGALGRLISAMKVESPECAFAVTNAGDTAMVTLEPAHPPTPVPNAPPMQMPIVHFFVVQAFMPEGDVLADRARAKREFDDCMTDAGPGPHHKGRDMHAEGCSVGNGASRLPGYHVQQELSVQIPAYFTPPSECEKAVVVLKQQLTAYP
jgi:hypothetical protein